ncbi:MAG: methylated-DNA--[protein]-cysteine S-methyltransferase [Candidatus Micrarchaeaceae archaeon]
MRSSTKQELLRRLAKYRMTEFQTTVLSATLDIPRGKTKTYKQIAVAIGRPKAYRAVGSALKKNPLAPMIPCHRVIKSGGALGEYSGSGGAKRKMQLLKSEGAI